MLSQAEVQATPFDMFSAQAAGIYPSGFNPTTGIVAGPGRLGWAVRTRDGRTFRFCRMGAVAGVAGSVYQASAPVANHLALTPSAAAIGATGVSLTLGATAATQNQYAEGWLQVDTTPGNGIMYGVDSHLAISSSGTGTINLTKDDAIQVALTGSSRVGLIANPFADIIVCPTTVTNIPVGVPLFAIPIGQYGWVQTWGPCAVLINGTPAVGAAVVISGTTSGAVDVGTVAAELNTRHIGWMMQVGVSTKNNAVMLRLHP
jgi:hypothetical protein